MKLKFFVAITIIFHFSFTLAQTNPPPSVVQSILQSANEGDVGGQLGAAVLYDNGQGVPKNELEAIRWYRLAAEQGSYRAQHALGLKYFFGRSLEQNDGEAFALMKLSAEQGFANAQWMLGLMYRDGRGVAQSYADAFRWYRSAAVQGHSSAQGSLGLLYSDGLGVPQSLVLAYVWISLSVANAQQQRASDLAAARDQYATFLSPQALEQAQEIATRCFQSNYISCD
jgi:TPR repeat protein